MLKAALLEEKNKMEFWRRIRVGGEDLEEKIWSDQVFVLGFVFGFVHEFLGLEVKSGMARTQIWRKKKRKNKKASKSSISSRVFDLVFL